MLKTIPQRLFRDLPTEVFNQAHPNPDVYPWIPQRSPHTRRGLPGATDTDNVANATCAPWTTKNRLLNRATTAHNTPGKGPKKDNLI